jgi:hypothetical protein
MTAPWITALATVAERLNGLGVEWMLLGSAATALRGAAIVPGDIDIALLASEDVVRVAAVLPMAEAGDSVEWVSTTAQPVLQFGNDGETWTFGRWFVEGVKVELAHIDAPAVAELMVETRSPLVWAERETLACQGQRVPAAPVEVQLATMVARQQDARIEATLAAIDGVNVDLLNRAFMDREVEVPAVLQRLMEADL